MEQKIRPFIKLLNYFSILTLFPLVQCRSQLSTSLMTPNAAAAQLGDFVHNFNVLDAIHCSTHGISPLPLVLCNSLLRAVTC